MSTIKGNIFDIKRFAVHDGDGIRTTVFFKGCPLRCRWCHNPEGLFAEPVLSYTAHNCVNCGACAKVCKAHTIEDGHHCFDRTKCSGCGNCTGVCVGGALKLYGSRVEVQDLLPTLLRDKGFYLETNGGVTLSGGECLCQPEFCEKLLRQLKEQDIHTAVDTSGFVSRKALDAVMPYTDIFLYDIKAVDEEIHIKCTGQSNRLILENLKYLNRCQKAIEVRIPLIPGMNDGEIDGIAELLSGLEQLTKVRVLPYHRYAEDKYTAMGIKYEMPDFPTPETEETEAALRCLRAHGLRAE